MGSFILKISLNFIEAQPIRILRLLNVFLAYSQDYFLDKFLLFNSQENTNLLKLLIIYLPINYFYGFLYYTDTLSIVLIIYYFYINMYKNEAFKKNNKLHYFLVGKLKNYRFIYNFIILIN